MLLLAFIFCYFVSTRCLPFIGKVFSSFTSSVGTHIAGTKYVTDPLWTTIFKPLEYTKAGRGYLVQIGGGKNSVTTPLTAKKGRITKQPSKGPVKDVLHMR